MVVGHSSQAMQNALDFEVTQVQGLMLCSTASEPDCTGMCMKVNTFGLWRAWHAATRILNCAASNTPGRKARRAVFRVESEPRPPSGSTSMIPSMCCSMYG
eukprot:1646960-Amphidinium_carterae.2